MNQPQPTSGKLLPYPITWLLQIPTCLPCEWNKYPMTLRYHPSSSLQFLQISYLISQLNFSLFTSSFDSKFNLPKSSWDELATNPTNGKFSRNPLRWLPTNPTCLPRHWEKYPMTFHYHLEVVITIVVANLLHVTPHNQIPPFSLVILTTISAS